MVAPIRVFLVEDSPIALTILKRIVQSAPDLMIVGTATNGLDALVAIPQAQPHVICTDYHMPKMGGLEFTQRLMAEYPKPILVISASVQEEDTQNVFRLLEAGAVDVFPKPRTGLSSEYEENKAELIYKIRLLAGITVFTQRRSPPAIASSHPPPTTPPTAPKAIPGASRPSWAGSAAPASPGGDIRTPRIVAIGASTGGPQALKTLFSQLPAHFPVPIVCVQHISEGFLPGLVAWLSQSCSLRVQEALSGATPQAGTIYFAPDRYHLMLDNLGNFEYSHQAPCAGHRPSATILFNSVAAHYRRSAVGILLTGMGSDGAAGMQAIAEAGGQTIAQDESSCVVFGMPKEAIALGGVQKVLPIEEIAPFLLQKVFKFSGRF